MRLRPIHFLALGAFFALTSCMENKKKEEAVSEPAPQNEMAEEPTNTTPNIVGVAAGDDRFSTLVTAVQAADLAGTLSGEGPFTVFAPINDAFAALPEGTLEDLLKEENKEKLAGILTYHVVSGKVEAAAVIAAINDNNGVFNVTTVQGQEIALSLNDGKVVLTDANGGTSTVILTDVAASNGIIHAIDAVVLPAME